MLDERLHEVGGASEVSELAKLLEQMRPTQLQVIKAARRDAAAEALGKMHEVLEDTTRAKSLSKDLVGAERASLNAGLNGISEDNHRMLLLIGKILAGAVVIGIAISMFAARLITKPLAAAVALARRIGQGDLSSTITANGSDEISQLFDALGRMQADLKARIEEEGLMARANERIKNALDNVEANVMLVNSSEEIRYCNHMMMQTLEKLPGVDPATLIDEKLSTLAPGSATAIAVHNGLDDTHCEELTLGGRIFKVVANPVIGDNDEQTGTMMEWFDLTEQRDAEQQVEKVINDAVAGKLDTRLDAARFVGFMNTLATGVNQMLDSIVGPLHVAADYIERIAKGDIPEPIMEAYQGDFNLIKNNLNTCISAINRLVRDANTLAAAAIHGQLSTRADGELHQGEFRKIIEGVNNTLDAVVDPLSVAPDYVDRIARGDIPEPITADYQGDFNLIKDNLNTCITAINRLVDDADTLAAAAVKGELATRADSAQHQGDFRKIVEGVNNTLDAVINPLSVAADYVDRIAKGDIPDLITANYHGDFNLIKNNLNTCIMAINRLVGDADMLADAAMRGDLSTRADDTLHQGDFRRIVEGVNNTLDAVIDPLTVAADYVERIARGDIPEPITADYQGDFNLIKDNLNTCITAIDRLVSDAKILAESAVRGELSTRADSIQHQGDFRKIVEGVNDTLDAIVIPINESKVVMSALAEGDLTQQVNGSFHGEFAVLRDAVNGSINNLSGLVVEIRDSANSINNSAAEISRGNMDLSQRSEEQAASLKQTTLSLEKLTGTVKQNAESAKSANQLAIDTSKQAEQGGTIVRAAVLAMKEINDSTQEISKIINVIDEIAFQTNLLALNAAVEAARAGQQGAGFAVVASEVRNLAQRSAEAAKGTKDLINDSVEKVHEGSRLVNDSGTTLQEIVESVNQVNRLIGEVAVASEDQLTGIAQVNQAVSHIEVMTQKNAALVVQAAGASESSKKQSEGLISLIDTFVISTKTKTEPRQIEVISVDGQTSTDAQSDDLEVHLSKHVVVGAGN